MSRATELSKWLREFNRDVESGLFDEIEEAAALLLELEREKLVSARRIEELETRLADTRLARDAALAEAYQLRAWIKEEQEDGPTSISKTLKLFEDQPTTFLKPVDVPEDLPIG